MNTENSSNQSAQPHGPSDGPSCAVASGSALPQEVCQAINKTAWSLFDRGESADYNWLAVKKVGDAFEQALATVWPNVPVKRVAYAIACAYAAGWKQHAKIIGEPEGMSAEKWADAHWEMFLREAEIATEPNNGDVERRGQKTL